MNQVYIKKHNSKVPILVTIHIFQIKTTEFLEGIINWKVYKKILDSYFNTLINSHLTNLVSNHLIKKEQFWNLILKIYTDLRITLDNTNPLSKYSKLIVKGGNVLEFIYQNYINSLKKQFKIENVENFIKYTNKYFAKSDIDFALIINYNKVENEYNLSLFNKNLDIFKSRCLDIFEGYKKVLSTYLNPLSSILSKNLIDKLNTETQKIYNFILGVYDGISNKTEHQHRRLKKILIYLNDNKFYTSLNLDPIKNIPADTVITPVNIKTLNRDVIIEKIPNNTLNTKFYWQNNKRITFFTTNNKLMTGYMSPEIINKLYYARSDFTLLRLLLGFDLETKNHHLENNVRGEFIDLSINLPDDYWSKQMTQDPENIISYNFNGTVFFANSIKYLIRELIKILFGVEGDNVGLLTAHKFTKRLNRLFFLIFMELSNHYDFEDVAFLLVYLREKVTNQLPTDYVSFVMQEQFRFDPVRKSQLLVPTTLRRQSSGIFKKKNDNQTIRYLESGDSIIDSVLLDDNQPLYFFFETLFRIFSRTIESDSKLKEKENIIIDCFNEMIDNYLELIE